MKTEEEIRQKLAELRKELFRLERKWFSCTKDSIQIEFLKNNIAFICWALDEPYSEDFYPLYKDG